MLDYLLNIGTKLLVEHLRISEEIHEIMLFYDDYALSRYVAEDALKRVRAESAMLFGDDTLIN